MFAKINKDISFYSMRNKWIWELNEDNILKIRKSKIRSLERKNSKYASAFIDFKYLVMWRWVKKNTELTEKFISNFNKIVKKLKLQLTTKEEDFINNIEEFVFSSWRPLKSLNVKFELQPKENVSLLQSSVNLMYWDEKTEKCSMIGKYNAYYSNQRIIFCDDDQNIKYVIENNLIKSVDVNYIGVIVKLKSKSYLLRGENKLLSYVLLQNMIPELNLDYKNVIDYYKIYSGWDTILEIFN